MPDTLHTVWDWGGYLGIVCKACKHLAVLDAESSFRIHARQHDLASEPQPEMPILRSFREKALRIGACIYSQS